MSILSFLRFSASFKIDECSKIPNTKCGLVFPSFIACFIASVIKSSIPSDTEDIKKILVLHR